MRFLHWSWQVFKKWWVWLSLLPLLLDLVSAYVPTDYIPAPILDLLEVGGNWQLTLVLVTSFLLISAFLVHSETEDRLVAYEFQQPKYELEIKGATPEEIDARGPHVRVLCYFTMKATTAWKGSLTDINVYGESPLKGLRCWEVVRTEHLTTHGYFTQTRLPFAIPHPECDFEIVIRSEISGPVDSEQRKEWENAVIPVNLVMVYSTQPVEDPIQTKLPLNIQVDLGKQFDSILSKGPPAPEVKREQGPRRIKLGK